MSVMDLMEQDAPGQGQNGVWAEELSERLRTSELTRDEKMARPGLEARKSIRLDRSVDCVAEVAADASEAVSMQRRRSGVEVN